MKKPRSGNWLGNDKYSAPLRKSISSNASLQHHVFYPGIDLPEYIPCATLLICLNIDKKGMYFSASYLVSV
ncbi:MAG TPA: hypothetical protein DCK95_06450 [Anaerolineaceae bacterium]|nr:hypothetical protein [Anaerolineaceae bacterium]